MRGRGVGGREEGRKVGGGREGRKALVAMTVMLMG